MNRRSFIKAGLGVVAAAGAASKVAASVKAEPTGLDQLEGETVDVVADGEVYGQSPEARKLPVLREIQELRRKQLLLMARS